MYENDDLIRVLFEFGTYMCQKGLHYINDYRMRNLTFFSIFLNQLFDRNLSDIIDFLYVYDNIFLWLR